MLKYLLPSLLLASLVACNKAPTFNDDVQPILAEHCQSCHVEGGIGPMSLVTYQEALDFADSISFETETRSMPPFHIDNSGECNKFDAGTLYLSDEEISLLSRWVAAGAPEGRPKTLPPAPAPETLTTANLNVGLTSPFVSSGQLFDEYRCFVLDPGLTEDAFLTAYELIPGDRRIVHHAILFSLDTPEAQAQAEALDDADPEDGYTCFGGSNVSASQVAAIWAPSVPVQRYPTGTGIRLPAQRKVVLQIHYNFEQGVFPDQTKLSMEVASSVNKEALYFLFGDFSLNLLPNQESSIETASLVLPANTPEVTIFGTFPHMHTHGRELRVDKSSGGVEQCMLNVSDWDFSWQGLYLYQEPLKLKGGDTLNIRCNFNTLGETDVITFGEGTSDEMCLNFFYLTL